MAAFTSASHKEKLYDCCRLKLFSLELKLYNFIMIENNIIKVNVKKHNFDKK